MWESLEVMLLEIAASGFEPLTSRLCIPLQLSLPALLEEGVGLWSGLSLHPSAKPGGCLPSSLYTFSDLLVRAWLGITTARGFPDFDRLSHQGLP